MPYWHAETACVRQRAEPAKARARHAAQRALMPAAGRPGRHGVPLHHHQGQGPRCHQPQRPCRWCIHMTCMHLPKYILLLQFVFQFIYMAHACLSSVSCIRVMHACSDHFESVSCCGVQINDPCNRRFVSSCEILNRLYAPSLYHLKYVFLERRLAMSPALN